jgi:hypothetical protein
MPLFSKEDFTQENATRLTVIILKEMGKKPTTSFRDLPPTQQQKFNRLMNEYLQGLGEDWEPKLMGDFNRIVNEDILNEEFDPTKTIIKDVVPFENREILLSEDQKEWIKQETEEKGVAPQY